LRKQWYQELGEKFFLPCRILEAKSYNAAIKVGQFRPFDVPEVVICSYHFARSKAADVSGVPWDLVVIDEAHRLRNVYKPTNVIANILKLALVGKDKLLLTATPLQNSLLELFWGPEGRTDCLRGDSVPGEQARDGADACASHEARGSECNRESRRKAVA